MEFIILLQICIL